MLYNLFENRDFVSVFAVALLAEGVDRNSKEVVDEVKARLSPSSRRAWIEILFGGSETTALQVALLAEGVDRNFDCSEAAAQFEVALLAEGVDRNYVSEITPEEITTSPSSRRAWIEIAQSAAAP